MNTLTIRQKLYEYIKFADDEKVEAIYTIVKDEVSELYEWWNDDSLIADLDKRSDELKTGKDKGISWAQTKNYLLNKQNQGE
jgi:hypothetical protein